MNIATYWAIVYGLFLFALPQHKIGLIRYNFLQLAQETIHRRTGNGKTTSKKPQNKNKSHTGNPMVTKNPITLHEGRLKTISHLLGFIGEKIGLDSDF